MKFLILIAVITQLSLADKTITKVVQPPNEKLYPIFDLIATKMQEHSRNQYIWFAGITNRILPEYKKIMKTLNTAEYMEFNDAFLEAVNTLEHYAQDPENCQLERAAYIETLRIFELKPADDYKIQQFFQNISVTFLQGKNVIRDLIKQLPQLIQNYLESLTKEEKQQNPKLYRAGEDILKATGMMERYNAIKSFMNEAQYDKNLAEANDENCKWDLTNFDEFVLSILNRPYYFETD